MISIIWLHIGHPMQELYRDITSTLIPAVTYGWGETFSHFLIDPVG